MCMCTCKSTVLQELSQNESQTMRLSHYKNIMLEFSEEGRKTCSGICEFRPMLWYQESVIQLAHRN